MKNISLKFTSGIYGILLKRQINLLLWNIRSEFCSLWVIHFHIPFSHFLGHAVLSNEPSPMVHSGDDLHPSSDHMTSGIGQSRVSVVGEQPISSEAQLIGTDAVLPQQVRIGFFDRIVCWPHHDYVMLHSMAHASVLLSTLSSSEN